MRVGLLDELVCPACRRELALEDAREKRGEVESGRLRCAACGAAYPVADGVPRMLPELARGADRHWDDLHRRTDYARTARAMEARFALPEPVLLDYFSHAALLRAQGPAPARALELGVGSGSYSLALHRLAGVRSFCLLDISVAALAGAQAVCGALGLPADYVQGDIRQLPFRDRAFPLVLSGGLIEHFAGAEQDAIMAEHCRAAARVLIEAPASTPAYWTFRAVYSLQPGGWPFGFERPLTRRRAARLLAAQGFRPLAWGGHDFAAAVELLGAQRWPAFPRLHRWPGAAALTRHDLIVYAQADPGLRPAAAASSERNSRHA